MLRCSPSSPEKTWKSRINDLRRTADVVEDKELFDLIKTLILMIFSYYFGTKNTKKE